MKRRAAAVLLLALATACAVSREDAARREIQSGIDASIDADRRKDVAARLALLTPDSTVTLLSGETLRREQLEKAIANFQRATIAFGPETRTTIERLELHGDEATVFTSQHLVRTVTANGRPAERVSEMRHRETWVRTPGGWRVRHVEELEQGPVTLDGKEVHVDRAGLAFVREIRQEGLAAARARFRAARQRLPNAQLFDESTLNEAGYSFLGAGRTAEAIELFRLNTEAYPRSSNVWDSLGEAYAAANDKAHAAESYRKALALTPGEERIAGVLASLGAPVGDEERAAMFAAVLPAEVELVPNVDYGGARMHLLLPKQAAAPRPAILFIHGGGWSEGTKERGVMPLLTFVQRGYVGATIDYRLSQQALFPAQIHDVKCAIRFLRANAARFGLDPRRIAVWGQSAGGHLAALAGTSSGVAALEPACFPGVSSRPDAVIDWNGPTDFLEPNELARLLAQKEREKAPTIAMERLLGGPVTERRELAMQANPILSVTADDPPFLIFHGDADDAVGIEQSRALDAALRRAGVESTLVVLPGERHFGPNPNRPLEPRFADPMLAFLERHFR